MGLFSTHLYIKLIKYTISVKKVILMKFLKTKKAQLGLIEFKYFMIGLIIGLIVGIVLVLLGTKGVLPFTIPVC
jgi:hypothetical protein